MDASVQKIFFFFGGNNFGKMRFIVSSAHNTYPLACRETKPASITPVVASLFPLQEKLDITIQWGGKFRIVRARLLEYQMLPTKSWRYNA